MRVIPGLFVAAATLLLASGYAIAQRSSANAAAPKASMAAQAQLIEIKNDDARATSLKMSRKDLVASSIYGSDGKKIASVSRVLGDNSGNIKAVTADVGSFLGMGSKEVVFPIDKLSKSDERNHLTTTMTKGDINQLQQYASSDSVRSGSAESSRSSMIDADTAGSQRQPP